MKKIFCQLIINSVQLLVKIHLRTMNKRKCPDHKKTYSSQTSNHPRGQVKAFSLQCTEEEHSPPSASQSFNSVWKSRPMQSDKGRSQKPCMLEKRTDLLF